MEYAFFHGDDFDKFLKSIIEKISDHISTIHTRADDYGPLPYAASEMCNGSPDSNSRKQVDITNLFLVY